jgi:hypothetical protein
MSGIIDELVSAVNVYATDNVATQIVDVDVSGTGEVLNVGDVVEFKVRVTNQGQLNMKGVVVRVVGTEYADVSSSGANGPFSSQADSASFNLESLPPLSPYPPPSTHTTGPFWAKMTKKTGAIAPNIVTAGILKWDASLDHILFAHSGRGAREGALSAQIYPSK